MFAAAEIRRGRLVQLLPQDDEKYSPGIRGGQWSHLSSFWIARASVGSRGSIGCRIPVFLLPRMELPPIISVVATAWHRRIERAETLARQHAFAAEILSFYSSVARLQEALYQRLASATGIPRDLAAKGAGPSELAWLTSGFEEFLRVMKMSMNVPAPMSSAARELHGLGEGAWLELLNNTWLSAEVSPSQPAQFLARAFLQPYAEWLRSRTDAPRRNSSSDARCPFCTRKAGLGVLRQQGEGGRRSLICSFCLAEWDFRRIVCPSCGEEQNGRLPVYTAEEFDYIRVECCDTCKTYLKAINLTRNGLAEPIVDELVSAPLDLWAHEHGYTKLELNLIGM
jgi:formate dehydrogenase accessory protein FdhE